MPRAGDAVTGAEWCRWHGGLIAADEAVLVGAVERGSGPPLMVHACPGCARAQDLLPLAEHPESSDGTPRTRQGTSMRAPRSVTRSR